jgi:hypothetical protein
LPHAREPGSVVAMPSYLIEAYLAAEPSLLDEARRRARRAAQLSEEVRYVWTTFVPCDETCFHLFEAPSSEALAEAVRLAELDHLRIVEAVETAARTATAN